MNPVQKFFHDPSSTIASATYDRALSVAPENTETNAADHDHDGTGKIVLPTIVNCDAVKDLHESSLSSGEDRNRFVNVSAHNRVLQKSDDFHHATSRALALRE